MPGLSREKLLLNPDYQDMLSAFEEEQILNLLRTRLFARRSG
jgi:hypothetical protein